MTDSLRTHTVRVVSTVEPDAILAVRLPESWRDALKAEAESHQRSMSGQVRWLIGRHLRDVAAASEAEAEAA